MHIHCFEVHTRIMSDAKPLPRVKWTWYDTRAAPSLTVRSIRATLNAATIEDEYSGKKSRWEGEPEPLDRMKMTILQDMVKCERQLKFSLFSWRPEHVFACHVDPDKHKAVDTFFIAPTCAGCESYGEGVKQIQLLDQSHLRIHSDVIRDGTQIMVDSSSTLTVDGGTTLSGVHVTARRDRFGPGRFRYERMRPWYAWWDDADEC
jgi:hypothetical protein